MLVSVQKIIRLPSSNYEE